MAVQTLNPVQRALVNETVRPAIERLIGFRYWLEGLIQELSQQQAPIANNADDLGDGSDGTVPRTDAPKLTGANVASLLTFATNMRDQISPAALNALTQLSIRDVPTVIRQMA